MELQPHCPSETRPRVNRPKVTIVQHTKYNSKLILDNSLISIHFLLLRKPAFDTNIFRTSTNSIHTTIQPSTQRSRNQNPPPHFTQHHFHLHFQHGQVKEKRPQDPKHLLRQSQLQRLRQAHHQPPLQREGHQRSRHHGRQSLRFPVALLQEQSAVEAFGSAGQALLARDEAESIEFSATERGGERVSDGRDGSTLRRFAGRSISWKTVMNG